MTCLHRGCLPAGPVCSALFGKRGETFSGFSRLPLGGVAGAERVERRAVEAAPGALENPGFGFGDGDRAVLQQTRSHLVARDSEAVERNDLVRQSDATGLGGVEAFPGECVPPELARQDGVTELRD